MVKKIIISFALASSLFAEKPYIGNYKTLLLTKEQNKSVIPKITAYGQHDFVKQINDQFQATNVNLRITDKELKGFEKSKFLFSGGSLKDLIEFLNSKNIFVSKFNDVVFLKNNGESKYEIGMYHSKKEIEELKKKIIQKAKATSIKEEHFFDKTFFVVNASPYGQKIAKQIIEKDVSDQIAKKKRLKIEFTKGDTKVLVAGVRLDRPMTVQHFFKVLGGQNLKNYIVKGNANIPMNDNIVIYSIRDLKRYLRAVNGVKLKTRKDGKYTIVEVIEK